MLLEKSMRPTKRKKHDSLYHTLENSGEKWQIDVKFVPSKCNSLPIKDTKFYQYTILDETSRKRCLYFTNEHSMYENVKALKAAIKFFGYIPKEIQSDNKFEFSDRAKRKENGKNNRKCPYILEDFLNKYGVKRHFIRPRTSEHNEKNERSHRIDQEKSIERLNFIV